MPRVLLLMSTRTYRARPFLTAARRLGVEVVVGSERRQALAGHVRNTTLALDFRRPDRAVRRIVRFARDVPLDAVIGVDDDTAVLAALAAAALGLPHNAPDAVRATRDKYRLRRVLAHAGLPGPAFQRWTVDADPARAAAVAPYPCVLKPTALAASRGVIRADTPAEFVAAFQRIAALLAADDANQRHILVESFLPGPEVALEGLLVAGQLHVLAVFDKPDPLDGPYFEETLYITPSRHPPVLQAAVADRVARAAAALGLREGPLHAELRVGPGGPYVLEIAARSIGGLCSRTLRFGAGISLEELILRHAVGLDLTGLLVRERAAAGVMMLPIPRAGVLYGVQGEETARRVPGIEGLEITIPLGQPVVPLPEGDRYLGFLFARGDTPEAVEAALREAHARLGFLIGPADAPPAAAECLAAGPARLALPVVGQPR
ncbi:MAG: ATP-grasp domain-containing protein [Chloroflexi bacterium]|nr:ATP-grasp domain-containing protein [Chloroflexota bacterium]